MAAKKKAPELPDLPPIVVDGATDNDADTEPHEPLESVDTEADTETAEEDPETEKEPESKEPGPEEYEPTELDMQRIRMGTVPQLEEVLATDGLPPKLAALVDAELKRRAEAEERSKPKRGQRLKTTARALRATRDGFLTEVPTGTLFDLSEADTLEAEGIPFGVVTVQLTHDQMGVPLLVEVV